MTLYSAYGKKILIIGIVLAFVLIIYGLTGSATATLQQQYRALASPALLDRNGEIISAKPNQRGYYARYSTHFPLLLTDRLLEREDRYFFVHPGINPVSTLRAFIQLARGKQRPPSSTITQQLVKILLQQENNRSYPNKLKEIWYAVSLELHTSKADILTMYGNSVFLGNNVQGFALASQLYFNKTPELLTAEETERLLITVQNPSNAHPFATLNTQLLASNKFPEPAQFSENTIQIRKDLFRKNIIGATNGFELRTIPLSCTPDCKLTLDKNLTEKIRETLKRNLAFFDTKKVDNGAIVVIKLPENELLAMVGSPDPTATERGYQINMARSPRPIGSTIKPFLYLEGFQNGLRPYSLVDDQEYKYEIGSGFAFYPKNYDYTYHGRVTLHYALSNSLNVPSVKVLEYIGLEKFYDFLTKRLRFVPIQPIESYQLGIALGGLEMDLLQLTYYFTLFGNQGNLLPLTISKGVTTQTLLPPAFSKRTHIADSPYVALVNAILNDRLTGIDQFGLASNLNLPATNYAVKTGTSREFHDSWTIGYTPDFVVGVWTGNSDNTAMDSVSGTIGAGRIWNEVMNLMLASPYNHKTPLDWRGLIKTQVGPTTEYGLPSDNFKVAEQKLLGQSLITSPHAYDTFLWEPNIQIPLRANESVNWAINGEPLGEGREILFHPSAAGIFKIKAESSEGEVMELSITVKKDT